MRRHEDHEPTITISRYIYRNRHATTHAVSKKYAVTRGHRQCRCRYHCQLTRVRSTDLYRGAGSISSLHDNVTAATGLLLQVGSGQLNWLMLELAIELFDSFGGRTHHRKSSCGGVLVQRAVISNDITVAGELHR